MLRPLANHKGFTLIELLVALAIVSVVAVLSWQGLENVIRLTNRVRATDEELAQLRSVFGQLSNDLKNVPNARLGPANVAASSGGSTAPPTPNEDGVRSPNERRPDVTIEDEETLDTVVDDLLSKGEKIQLLSNGFQIQTLQKSPTDGLNSLLVTWRFEQGRLLRSSRFLKANVQGLETGNPMATANLNMFAAEEVPLQVSGFSVRLWSEGKGWTAESNFGAVLPPPAESTAQTAQPVAEANANPSTVARTLGVEIRVLMPTGKLYNRVFMVGSAS
jgi:prepilin-type N-terminal cleavage/methylation domain-containing protein